MRYNQIALLILHGVVSKTDNQKFTTFSHTYKIKELSFPRLLRAHSVFDCPFAVYLKKREKKKKIKLSIKKSNVSLRGTIKKIF